MTLDDDAAGRPGTEAAGRRDAVLESALATFSRFGYRKTSMDDVAAGAHISRPGLYFLFRTKEALFRAAVSRSLEADLAAADRILADTDQPLPDRLLDAFQQWTGRYLGALADISVVIEDNPALLGPVVDEAPRRFATLVTEAVAAGPPGAGPARAEAVAQTLISTSVGLKHQVDDPGTYRERLAVAIRLVLR